MKYRPDYGGQPRFSCPRTMHELREEEKRRRKRLEENPPPPSKKRPPLTEEQKRRQREQYDRDLEEFLKGVRQVAEELKRKRGEEK